MYLSQMAETLTAVHISLHCDSHTFILSVRLLHDLSQNALSCMSYTGNVLSFQWKKTPCCSMSVRAKWTPTDCCVLEQSPIQVLTLTGVLNLVDMWSCYVCLHWLSHNTTYFSVIISILKPLQPRSSEHLLL